MKILMIGYYGYHNLGDDLFVQQLTSYFIKQDLIEKVWIICQDDYYPKQHPKLTFIQTEKLSPFQRLLLILKTDAMIWGGGTLSLDSEPKNLSRQQRFCRLLGKTFAFLGVGLEAINSPSASPQISRFFQNANFLYVRDDISYELVKQQLKKSTTPLHLGGDLACLDLEMYQPFQKQTVSSQTELKNISFTGKHWWGEGRAKFYAEQLMPVIEKYNSMIHLIPAQSKAGNDDNEFHQRLQNFLPQNQCKIYTWETPEEYFKILSEMDFHIGNRLHTVIAADLIGVPNLGIGATDSKIDNYIKKTQMLPLERVVDFMEPISLERVETIWKTYKQPLSFLTQESQTAQEGVQKLLTFKKID